MRKITLMVFCVVCILISACGVKVFPTTTPIVQPTNTPPPTATANQGFKVTDALSRELSFTQLPQRIVVAGKATPLIINTLYLFPETKQRLAGVEQRSQSKTAANFMLVIDPDYDKVSKLETNASAEQIAPLKPDVVIMKTSVKEQLGSPLEKLGISVFYVDLETPETFVKEIKALGQLLGNPDRADQVAKFYLDKQQQVEKSVAGQSSKPKVLVLQYSDKGGEVSFNIPPASWLQTIMTEKAGGEAIWKDASQTGGWTIVNFEQIAAWNPEQIFIISYQGNASDIVSNLKADSKWQALKAVQSKQLFAFAGDYTSWDQPDTRWILGLAWMATKIHPELAKEIDILPLVSLFFSEMYGLSQETIDNQIMKNLNGDVP